MTRQELKEEMRQSEGDPVVKARIRDARREITTSSILKKGLSKGGTGGPPHRQMMQEVSRAKVVIANSNHLAVVLTYNAQIDAAPKLCAKGSRLIAERIEAVARDCNVPIVEDRPLARALYSLELGQEIPGGLYRAVAGILARIPQGNRDQSSENRYSP